MANAQLLGHVISKTASVHIAMNKTTMTLTGKETAEEHIAWELDQARITPTELLEKVNLILSSVLIIDETKLILHTIVPLN